MNKVAQSNLLLLLLLFLSKTLELRKNVIRYLQDTQQIILLLNY
jgi:hypothetical protein